MRTRNDKDKRQKKKNEGTRSTERDYREYLLCDQSIKIKCRWGDTVFYAKADGFKTNRNKRTVAAQMHFMHPRPEKEQLSKHKLCTV